MQAGLNRHFSLLYFMCKYFFACFVPYERSNDLPNISDKTNNTRNIKNKILAMLAAPAAMPPNPKIAATIATIRNVIVQRNIIVI